MRCVKGTGAGRHGHAERAGRAAGDRRADILDPVARMREPVEVLRLHARLVAERHLGGPGYDEVALDPGFLQQLQHPDPVGHPGGAGNSHDETGVLGKGRFFPAMIAKTYTELPIFARGVRQALQKESQFRRLWLNERTG